MLFRSIHNSQAADHKNHGEHPPGVAKRTDLLKSDRRKGDHRHVESFEPGVIFQEMIPDDTSGHDGNEKQGCHLQFGQKVFSAQEILD